jgi:hypothetical protein
VFENGQFMQIIEGDETIIKSFIIKIIAKDSRHQDVKVLKEAHGVCLYSEWSMSQLPIGLFGAQFNISTKKSS